MTCLAFQTLKKLSYLILIGTFCLIQVKSVNNSNDDNTSYWYPCDDEFEIAYSCHAPKWWGARIRREKSFRIAFIGGSQTSNWGYPAVFKDKLNNYLKMRNSWDPNKFKVYNEGLAGALPELRIYNFESFTESEWPNVIAFEYGLNCHPDIRCAKSVDKLISYIKDKYDRRNLSLPYFMFIEFFRMGIVYGDYDFWPTFVQDEKLTVISSNPNISSFTPASPGFDMRSTRGSGASMFLLELARFQFIRCHFYQLKMLCIHL